MTTSGSSNPRRKRTFARDARNPPGNSLQSCAVTKKFLVEITESARRDIRLAHSHIADDNPQAAERWRANVERMIVRLETFPFAHEVIPEAAALGMDFRHKLFGNYRIIYRVQEDCVFVLRVIHGARLLDQSMFVG